MKKLALILALGFIGMTAHATTFKCHYKEFSTHSGLEPLAETILDTDVKTRLLLPGGQFGCLVRFIKDKNLFMMSVGPTATAQDGSLVLEQQAATAETELPAPGLLLVSASNDSDGGTVGTCTCHSGN